MGYQEYIKRVRAHGGVYSPTPRVAVEWLYDNASQAAAFYPELQMLELGTLQGFTAFAIGDAIQDRQKRWVIADQDLDQSQKRITKAKLYSVDSYGRSDVAAGSYKTNLEACASLGYDGVVNLVAGDDYEYLSKIKDGSLSLLFIDSDHAYRHVQKLLAIALPKMANGALICGDDYRFTDRGVVRAVEEWRKKHEYELIGFSVSHRFWWAIKAGGGLSRREVGYQGGR